MKISKAKTTEKIVMKTKSSNDIKSEIIEWWTFDDEKKASDGLCATAAYLKTNQTWRMRQLAADVRLYCGLSVYSYAGSNVSRMDQTKTLPEDRPTFNLVSSCTDTIVARLQQSRPAPKFLTDNGDYKQRHLAERLNNFIQGEFYQTKFYEKSVQMLRDACVMGTGALKVYWGENDKVAVDRVMVTDLFVDMNDAINGEPQQMYQLKLVDRRKFMKMHPDAKKVIQGAENAYPDNNNDTARTNADQIMIVEGWKLPSLPGAKDGRHMIACVNGLILDEVWEKDWFPFVFMRYSNPFLGFFGQGIATRLFGTQLTLNRILYTIARAITLVGVPRIFQDFQAKAPTSHHNNEIGTIVKCDMTRGKPEYVVAPCNAPELYSERDKLISYGYQQEGISMQQASSVKPAGLDSGEAQRVYDDIASDRMAETAKKYDQVFIDGAYLITYTAMDIAKETGKYQTVYPNKDGTKEIDLPAMKFLQDPFIIQCFNESSLPKDPAGRAQAIVERVQSGMLTVKEGSRLLGNLDSDQIAKLDNASEERIYKYLDEIVEEGKFTAPDVFMDLQLAQLRVVQYYNLYVAAKLEDKRAQMLIDWWTTVNALTQAATPPQAPQGAPQPTANPQPTPTSPMVPNTNAGAAA